MNQLVGKYIQEFKLGIATKGSFTQNLAITFSGNAFAQALGFLFTPFIARIYGPDVYGLFALFISITNNLAPVATLQFPSAFVIAKNHKEFLNLVRVTVTVLILFSTASFIIVHFFKGQILNFFHATELLPYIYLIPLYFFFMGGDHIVVGWNIRHKEFFRGAVSKIFSTSVSKGITLGWGGLVSPTAMGMILGNLLLFPLESILKLSRSMRNEFGSVLKNISWPDITGTFRNFKSYPCFVMPGMLISNLSSQLPVYYFSVAFSQTIVGYFALANSLVMMPISIIITSSTSVFLQRAAELHQRDPAQLKDSVLSLYKRLSIVSIISLAAFAFVSKWVFMFLFGSDWAQAGVFASLLAAGALFFVPVGPLSVVFRLTRKEHISFGINVVFTAIKFLGLFWGSYHQNIYYAIVGFSLASLLSNGTTLYWIFRLIDLKKNILYRDLTLVLLLFFFIVYLNS